jgi:hypothetical protein
MANTKILTHTFYSVVEAVCWYFRSKSLPLTSNQFMARCLYSNVKSYSVGWNMPCFILQIHHYVHKRAELHFIPYDSLFPKDSL